MYECVKHGKVTCKQCAGGTEGWQEVTGGRPSVENSDVVNDDESRLSEIKTRLEKTTPGGWHHSDAHGSCVVTENRTVMICDLDPEGGYRTYTKWSGRWSDADFIAHARQDIPWLIEQLAEAMERVQRADDCCRQVLELQAKIELLEKDSPIPTEDLCRT